MGLGDMIAEPILLGIVAIALFIAYLVIFELPDL
jgi:hypothetical protein